MLELQSTLSFQQFILWPFITPALPLFLTPAGWLCACLLCQPAPQHYMPLHSEPMDDDEAPGTLEELLNNDLLSATLESLPARGEHA